MTTIAGQMYADAPFESLVLFDALKLLQSDDGVHWHGDGSLF